MLATAYFACGCFWGAQYYFAKFEGISHTAVGYMGGHIDSPTYAQVKKGDTGHFETTEVAYDPAVVSYQELVRYFFEIHDFSQTDGQGPDIGSQYLSAIFVQTPDEQVIVADTIKILRDKGYTVATQVKGAGVFWKGEDYHQDYYEHKGTSPYCHSHRKIF
jgi:methionine-S-sulfoxide reductase